MTRETCLFDLDGTLTDPKAGITGCIQYALKKLNQPVPTPEELTWAIGPPLHESFLLLLNRDTEAAALGLAYYRERFGTVGMFENHVYEGIIECLEKIHTAGLTLFIATSKPHYYAKQIARHFGFDHFFKHIHGSEMSGERVDKGELIEHILKTEALGADRTFMIGDRKHDILGAKRFGIRTIGVLYGYGSRTELTEAGADTLVNSPGEIPELVLS